MIYTALYVITIQGVYEHLGQTIWNKNNNKFEGQSLAMNLKAKPTFRFELQIATLISHQLLIL